MQGKLLCGFFILSNLFAGAQIPVLPEGRHHFIVIAHRGDHTEVPENTMASYEYAIGNAVDYVEIDLRTTRDSVLVIMHDETVDRMTNGKGKLSELRYADLRLLRVRDISKDSGKIYQIPSFAEVLKTCKGKINIYLDFKNASVLQTYRLIREYGMEKHVIVYINEPFQYTEWRRLVPDMPLMVSLPEGIKNGQDLIKFLSESPVALLDGDYTDYTTDVFKTASTLGLAVWPDIQGPDEANNWDKALELGFMGLQTDHPLALISYLKKKALR